MTKIVTANIPARKVKMRTEIRTLPARVDTFTQDDEGKWWHSPFGAPERICESDVIEVCQKASNWPAIRAEHFVMHGFHS